VKLEHVKAADLAVGDRVLYRRTMRHAAQLGTVERLEPCPVAHVRVVIVSDAGTRATLTARVDGTFSVVAGGSGEVP